MSDWEGEGKRVARTGTQPRRIEEEGLSTVDFVRRFLACITQHGSDRLYGFPFRRGILDSNGETCASWLHRTVNPCPIPGPHPAAVVLLPCTFLAGASKSSRQRGGTQDGGSQR